MERAIITPVSGFVSEIETLRRMLAVSAPQIARFHFSPPEE
jgi:hypothetical protein